MTDEYLAIIPARSGSKRLPQKNIRIFCGKPLIYWSISAAQNCTRISRVFFSTDSEAYRQLALQYGAECPWLREPALSTDITSSADVVRHHIQRLGQEAHKYRAIILLQPTSPLRTSRDIEMALDLYESSGAPAVVSVCQAECPRQWLGRIPGNLHLDDFIASYAQSSRSQDHGTWYRVNGAIYIINLNNFMLHGSFLPKGSLGFIMPRDRSLDIDTQLDFDIAQYLMLRGRVPLGGVNPEARLH